MYYYKDIKFTDENEAVNYLVDNGITKLKKKGTMSRVLKAVNGLITDELLAPRNGVFYNDIYYPEKKDLYVELVKDERINVSLSIFSSITYKYNTKIITDEMLTKYKLPVYKYKGLEFIGLTAFLDYVIDNDLTKVTRHKLIDRIYDKKVFDITDDLLVENMKEIQLTYNEEKFTSIKEAYTYFIDNKLTDIAYETFRDRLGTRDGGIITDEMLAPIRNKKFNHNGVEYKSASSFAKFITDNRLSDICEDYVRKKLCSLEGNNICMTDEDIKYLGRDRDIVKCWYNNKEFEKRTNLVDYLIENGKCLSSRNSLLAKLIRDNVVIVNDEYLALYEKNIINAENIEYTFRDNKYTFTELHEHLYSTGITQLSILQFAKSYSDKFIKGIVTDESLINQSVKKLNISIYLYKCPLCNRNLPFTATQIINHKICHYKRGE